MAALHRYQIKSMPFYYFHFIFLNKKYLKYRNNFLKSLISTSNLIEQPSIPVGEVSIVPKHRQQWHIHVVGETTGERSREQILLVLGHRLKLHKTIIRKLREGRVRVDMRQILNKLIVIKSQLYGTYCSGYSKISLLSIFNLSVIFHWALLLPCQKI